MSRHRGKSPGRRTDGVNLYTPTPNTTFYDDMVTAGRESFKLSIETRIKAHVTLANVCCESSTAIDIFRVSKIGGGPFNAAEDGVLRTFAREFTVVGDASIRLAVVPHSYYDRRWFALSLSRTQQALLIGFFGFTLMCLAAAYDFHLFASGQIDSPIVTNYIAPVVLSQT